jgi:hypothetical protein
MGRAGVFSFKLALMFFVTKETKATDCRHCKFCCGLDGISF